MNSVWAFFFPKCSFYWNRKVIAYELSRPLFSRQPSHVLQSYQFEWGAPDTSRLIYPAIPMPDALTLAPTPPSKHALQVPLVTLSPQNGAWLHNLPENIWAIMLLKRSEFMVYSYTLTLPRGWLLRSRKGKARVCWRKRHVQMNLKLRSMSFTPIQLLQDQRGP